MSQMIRSNAKTTPTTALARTIVNGILNTKSATTQAVISPAIAAFHALALPVTNKPRSTKIGVADISVDAIQ
jgi:hypothetical protein